jgi:hypothetical protein
VEQLYTPRPARSAWTWMPRHVLTRLRQQAACLRITGLRNPAVVALDAATQNHRSLLTHRASLTKRRAQHKNRIQCVLSRMFF